MKDSTNTLIAALQARQLAQCETTRAVMFLDLFLTLPNRKQGDVLRVMQDFVQVATEEAPGVQVAALLDAERYAASELWTVLHELRIGAALPAWVQVLEVGTTFQHDALERSRAQLDSALESSIPGFIPVRRRKTMPIPCGTL